MLLLASTCPSLQHLRRLSMINELIAHDQEGPTTLQASVSDDGNSKGVRIANGHLVQHAIGNLNWKYLDHKQNKI